MFVLFVMQSYLIEVRGLKLIQNIIRIVSLKSYLIEVRGLKLSVLCKRLRPDRSYLIEVRGLKPVIVSMPKCMWRRIL